MNLTRFSPFPSWEDAYESCRERDVPMDVSTVDNDCIVYARIYPSGSWKMLAITLNEKAVSNEDVSNYLKPRKER